MEDELASSLTSMSVIAMPLLIVMILVAAEISRELRGDPQKTSKDIKPKNKMAIFRRQSFPFCAWANYFADSLGS